MNKREHERYPARIRVAFTRNGKTIEALSRDISLGGMFVETGDALAFGTQLELLLVLPSLPEPTAVPATVRWSGSTGMGVAFGTLRAQQTWAINQLIRSVSV